MQASATRPFAGVDQGDLHAFIGGQKSGSVSTGTATEDSQFSFCGFRHDFLASYECSETISIYRPRRACPGGAMTIRLDSSSFHSPPPSGLSRRSDDYLAQTHRVTSDRH